MKITLAQQQSELLVLAESFFQASLVLDLIDDDGFSDEDRSDSDEDDIMDVLELTAFEWMKIAIMMSDGWHGPYNVFLKPQDFFFDILAGPRPLFLQNVLVCSILMVNVPQVLSTSPQNFLLPMGLSTITVGGFVRHFKSFGLSI